MAVVQCRFTQSMGDIHKRRDSFGRRYKGGQLIAWPATWREIPGFFSILKDVAGGSAELVSSAKRGRRILLVNLTSAHF